MIKFNATTWVSVVGVWITFHSGAALSSDWNITQTATVSGSTPQLRQEDVNMSNQALNGVVMDNGNDAVRNTTQSANLLGENLSMDQVGTATSANVQALNLTSAQAVDTLTQEVSGFSSIELTQDTGSGTGNIQALNYVQATTDIANLSQTATGADYVSTSSGLGNVQAINYAEAATYSGTLEQVTTLDTATITNLGGMDTRINSVKGNITGLSGSIIQTATIGTVTVNPGSMLIINHIEP